MSSGTRKPRPSFVILVDGPHRIPLSAPIVPHDEDRGKQFEYLLSPIALTSDATQAGPLFPSKPGWSEFSYVGVIQVIAASSPLPTSVRNCAAG